MTPEELVGVSEIVGSTRFDDPFRRLEEEGPDVHRWQARMHAEAGRLIQSLPSYRPVLRALDRHLAACATFAPVRAGSRWFRLEHTDDQDRLRASCDVGVPGDVLLQIDRRSDVANPRIDWFVPSPDGELVAIGVSRRGDEQTRLQVIDAESGSVVARQAPHVWGGGVAWLPGSDRLVGLIGGSASLSNQRTELVEFHIGERIRTLAASLRGSARRHSVQVSPDGRYVAVIEQPAAPRLLQVLDRVTGEWLVPAPLDADATRHGVFLNARYWAVTTDGAPRGRLVSAPVDRIADPGAWRTEVAESREVLRAVTAMGNTLVLCCFEGGASRLRLVSPAGAAVGSVSLPCDGLCSTDGRSPGQYGAVAPVHADPDGLTFAFASTGRSPTLMRYDAATRSTRPIGAPVATLDGVRRERRSCLAPDGIEVPYERVWRFDGEPDVPRPTLLVAYGGWNAMTTSRGYLGMLAPLVELGGAVVFAHVRGDATLGAERWYAGRRRLRQNGVTDACAVADDLLAGGIAQQGRLGICGTSNGGLLAATAMTQRPDLFCVVVAVVPLLDMGRFVRDRFGEHAAWEYGHPWLQPDAEALRAHSPYHNVNAGVRYPAALVVCGENDIRAPAWHGRKMVAALRRATAGDAPVLLRVHPSHGHLTAGEAAPSWLVAEWLAFVVDHLGLHPHDGA